MPRKPKTPEGRETNTQFVARLMERAASAPLSQLFIVEAVRKYADQCAEAAPDKLGVGPISGHAWKRCALEIQREVLKHLGE